MWIDMCCIFNDWPTYTESPQRAETNVYRFPLCSHIVRHYSYISSKKTTIYIGFPALDHYHWKDNEQAIINNYFMQRLIISHWPMTTMALCCSIWFLPLIHLTSALVANTGVYYILVIPPGTFKKRKIATHSQQSI